MMKKWLLLCAACIYLAPAIKLYGSPATTEVEKFGFFEMSLNSTGYYTNPYTDNEAAVELERPDGTAWTIPMFWDGGTSWKFRVSPDMEGDWSWKINSPDKGLNGRKGKFSCKPSKLRGSIMPMKDFPYHFQYQNGEPMWFMGETAWALFTDEVSEKLDRKGAEKLITTRAAQGFNVIHSMILSEAGWGNSGGMPFEDLSKQVINPGYWQEMDQRIGFANSNGIICGLAIAWGDKNKKVPFSWRMFPDNEARKRYVRYMAARYSAYKVFFLVSGEWHGEVRTRPSTEAELKKEFIETGNALDAAEPHGRMIAIHPMTAHGSVREFNDAPWMSFGDYQQNYSQVHTRLLESMKFNKPVVNSEYGYYLRDQDGDGVPDKDNSTRIESMRHATWDIVMAGGYFVTGFGTTYFGGFRDPGPFDVDAAKNDDWEMQASLIKKIFSGFEWWKLSSHDEWLSSASKPEGDLKHLGQIAPPARVYWLLAESGRHYLVYARGMKESIMLNPGGNVTGTFRARLINPVKGIVRDIEGEHKLENGFSWTPPDDKEWLLHLFEKSADQK